MYCNYKFVETPLCLQNAHTFLDCVYIFVLQFNAVGNSDLTDNYLLLLCNNLYIIQPFIDYKRTSLSPDDNSMLCTYMKHQFGCKLMLYYEQIVKYKYNSVKQTYKHKKLLYKKITPIIELWRQKINIK